jgi:hypothetical protein
MGRRAGGQGKAQGHQGEFGAKVRHLVSSVRTDGGLEAAR